MMRLGLIGFVVMSAVLVSGCAVTEELNRELFDTRKVNLTDSAYAAADMLAQQTKSHINQMTPVRIGVLTDVTTPNETTAFGNHIANQIGSRFVQLGYNVRSVPLPPAMTPNMAATPGTVMNPMAVGGAPVPMQTGILPSMAKNECLLTGTYTRMKDNILVSLRILQAPDSRVVAAYDYTVPMTREMNEMSISQGERDKRQTLNPLPTSMQ